MIFPKIISLLAISTAVFGQSPVGPGPTANYQAPSGVQIGTINENILCNLTVGGLLAIRNAQLSLRLGGALTTTAGAGGSFNIIGSSVVTGSLQFTQDLNTLNFTKFNGSVVTLTINAAGSTQGSVNGAATPILIPNTNVPPVGTAVVLTLPTTGAVTIGPITAASGVSSVVISVGAISANIVATNKNNKAVPTVLTCPATTQKQDLAFVSVGTGGTVVAPSGFFPPISTAAQSLLGSSGLTYACTIGGVSGTQSFPTSLTTFSPQLSAPINSNFQVQNSYGLITITQAQVNTVIATLPASQQSSATRFQITISSLAGTATNLPSPFSIVSSPVNSQVITLGTGPYTATIPGSGTLPPVTISTAGSVRGTALSFVGNANGFVLIADNNNNILANRTLSCVPPSTPRAPLVAIELS